MGISVDDGREPANSRSEDPVGRAKSSKFCGENGLKVCKPWKGKNSTCVAWDKITCRVSSGTRSGKLERKITRTNEPVSHQILHFNSSSRRVGGSTFYVVI
jgi:hypothetical protein